MFVEMTVFGFTLDTLTQKPVILLKDKRADTTIPIWITSTEAVSIAAELVSRDLVAQRGREDLLTTLLKQIGMSVRMIALDRVNDGVLSASVLFGDKEHETKIEVRPTEAIIGALKYRLPIMVAEEVVSMASVLALGEGSIDGEHNARRFVDYLEDLNPEDMGKYPM